MKQEWSKWLGVNLDAIEVTTETVSEVSARMQMLRHLKEGNKVLDSVNSVMKDMTGESSTLVYTHPSLSYDQHARVAIDSLAATITEITDAGTWPASWEGNSLKAMSLVLTAFATSLNTDYKALVTIVAKAYSNTYGGDAMIEQVKIAPAFAQQYILGCVLSLNMTQEQQQTWADTYNLQTSPGPDDVIRSLFDFNKPKLEVATTSSPAL